MPLRSWENLIGYCPFVPTEKRAPLHSYTAERFRLAQRLVNLRVGPPGKPAAPLPTKVVETLLADLGPRRSVTYKRVKQVLGQGDWVFEKLSYGRKDAKGNPTDPEKKDVVRGSGGCGEGTYVFFKVLGGEAGRQFVETRTTQGVRLIDAVARVLTTQDDIAAIRKGLEELPLRPVEVQALDRAVRAGDFAHFRRTARLSLQAMETILPKMIELGEYAAGCEAAGWPHAKTRPVDMDNVRNPVVLKILSEVRRQFQAVVRALGCVPGRVHVELLRDVGKGVEEREAIEKGLDRRSDEKDKSRKDFADKVGKQAEAVSATELLRYELWKEQQERCAYYMLWKDAGGAAVYGRYDKIRPEELLDGPNAAQIDHILPRSRTFDNSFHNLCLCRVEANQAKGNRTPWEWLGSDNPEAWHRHQEWVQQLRIKGFKKRNYQLKNLDEALEGRFHERNKQDSRYASRLVLHWLAEEYDRLGVEAMPEGEASDNRRRLFARPGGIVNLLRKSWGVQGLKTDPEGNRTGDRHHALDALIVALCTEGMLQRLTRHFQRMERWEEKNRPVPDLEEPWENFRHDAQTLVGRVFVSRAERGKEKGRLHEDTLRQMRTEQDRDGKPVQMLYERKPIKNLSAADLERIKDPERNPWLIQALQEWLDKGKPRDDLPRSPKGDPIRRVRLCAGRFTSGITVPRGNGVAQADNASIVRTDVFRKDGKYWLVPVYAHQIYEDAPPSKAIARGKDELDWPEMEGNARFQFSLQANNYVVAEKSGGVVNEGYFMGTDRSVAAIVLAAPHDHTQRTKIGVKNLKSFDKYRVDRLGNLHKVQQETHTWRGGACT
jgi:CRISPR-associated endonuclease Csn1